MAKVEKKKAFLAAPTIEKVHNLLAQDISNIFGFAVTVGEQPRTDWERSRDSISFDLRSAVPGRMKMVIDPVNGRKQVAVQLEPDPEVGRAHEPLNWWVGWREEWQPVGKAGKQFEFAFKAAAWSLYCSGDDGGDVLLVRAEWARPDENIPQNAAQPHWHVHHSQRIGAVITTSPLSVAEGELAEPQELNDEAPVFVEDELGAVNQVQLMIPPFKAVEISGIHLGMAGWDNGGGHPNCWQIPFGNLESTMRTWAVATLKYMRSQLCYVHLGESK